MDALIYTVCFILIAMNLLILNKSIKNYKYLNKKYLDSQAMCCLLNLENGLFKEKDFFYMQNSGISPCEPINDIEYKDYIGKSNLFAEKKTIR